MTKLNILVFLFLQPLVDEVDDVLSLRLGERENACQVRASLEHIDMQVLLVFSEGKSVDARSAPWVDVAIDVHHFGVVVG